MSDPLYIFLDESGDLGFNSSGSNFYVLTSVSLQRPAQLNAVLDEFRYRCIERGFEQEFFHCANERRRLRNEVFGLLGSQLEVQAIDSLIVEKRKTTPALGVDTRFYPEMLGHLLKYVLKRPDFSEASEFIIITDSPPIQKRREAIKKVVKTKLARMLPKGRQHHILHHQSRSHFCLQVADYCGWAIFRKYENGDSAAYDLIRSSIRSEYEIFKTGASFYY